MENKTMINESSSRDEVLKAVGEDYLNLALASPKFRDDDIVVARALDLNVGALQFASERLKSDLGFLDCCVNLGGILRFVSVELRDNEDFVAKVLETDDSGLEYASDRLRSSKDFALKILESNKTGWFLHHAAESVKDDEEVAFKVARLNGYAVAVLTERWRMNAEILEAAANDLFEASRAATLKEVGIFGLVKKDEFFTYFCSDADRADRGKILELISKGKVEGGVRFFSEDLKDDTELIALATRHHGWGALKFASKRLLDMCEGLRRAAAQERLDVEVLAERAGKLKRVIEGEASSENTNIRKIKV